VALIRIESLSIVCPLQNNGENLYFADIGSDDRLRVHDLDHPDGQVINML
jgi:hypothetical protein